MPTYLLTNLLGSALVFAAVFVPIRYGWGAIRAWVRAREELYEQTLNQELLMDVNPRTALALAGLTVAIGGLAGLAIFETAFATGVGAVIAAFVPGLVLRHMVQKRRERLQQKAQRNARPEP